MTQEEIAQVLAQARESNSKAMYAKTEEILKPFFQDATTEAEVESYTRACISMANALTLRSNAREGLEYALKAVNSAKKVDQDIRSYLLGLAYLCVAKSYDVLAEFDRALDYTQLALEVFKQSDDQVEVGHIYGSMASIYRDIGDYPRSLELFQQALDLHRQLGDSLGISMWTNGIGIVYQNLGDSEKALEYFNETLVLAEAEGAEARIATILGNIGEAYFGLERTELALEYAKRALAIDERLENSVAVARHTGNIGKMYLSLQDYGTALTCFQKALDIDTSLGARANAAAWTGLIGEVYSTPESTFYDLTKAEEYLLRGIELCRELSLLDLLTEFYKFLSEVYKIQERWKEHAEMFALYHESYSEMHSEQTRQETRMLEHRRKVDAAERDRQVKLARFQEQEKILHSILPPAIAERVVSGERRIIEHFDKVSVLFADIVGFTQYSQIVDANSLADRLDTIFSAFDHLAEKHGCEKIKTIGDCYMAVAGLPQHCDNHAQRLADLAIDMIEEIRRLTQHSEQPMKVRIGLHCGPVVAGILGKNKYAYDLWGDAVNTASRMESHGLPDQIHCSADFHRELKSQTGDSKGERYKHSARGEITVKDKGTMTTYLLSKA